MEEKLKEVSNQELMQIYRLILEHMEYLENENLKGEGTKNKSYFIFKLKKKKFIARSGGARNLF